MQVFKLYYKIFFRGVIASAIIYVVIFSIITIMFSNASNNPTSQAFNVSKCRVAIIDNDKSLLSIGLADYIKDNSKYVEIKDTSEEGLKDALFFRYAEYIFIIPENFGDNFFTDSRLSVETMRIPNSTSGMFLDTMVNKYLNTIELYIDGYSNITLRDAIDKTFDNLSIETDIKLANEKKGTAMPGFLYYFNYLPYALISILVLCISGITISINEIDIKRRNMCAPISTNKFNFGLFLGNLSISLALYLVFVIYAIIIFNKSIFYSSGLFIAINGLIFTVVCLSLCFLIANVANKNSVSAISTVLSLGACFLGGVFVPQELLSEAVKNVAVVNPVFWYVGANNLLGSLNTFNYQTLKPVIFSIIVEICFAIAFLAIALVVMKQKKAE